MTDQEYQRALYLADSVRETMTDQERAMADGIANRELVDPLEEKFGKTMANKIMAKSSRILAATYAEWLNTCDNAKEANAVLEFVGRLLMTAGRLRIENAEGSSQTPEDEGGFEA